jgi:hypothetical protein
VRAAGATLRCNDRHSKVTILGVSESVAIVRVNGPEWVDFLQMANWNGEWLIVNVLWELNPERRRRHGGLGGHAAPNTEPRWLLASSEPLTAF